MDTQLKAKTHKYPWVGPFVPLAAYLVCTLAIAAPARADVSIVRSGPPAIPATFDRSTVQSLVDNAEQGRNATILKVFYFNQRENAALPRTEGYAIVNAALQGATKGSERWFCLESLKGYAAFNLDNPAPSDGFYSYNAVFDNAALAKDPQSASELQKTVKEYVFDVLGTLGQINLQTDPNSQKTLVKAWGAYAVYLSSNSPVGKPPDWSGAVQATKSAALLKPLIAAEAKDATVGKTFEFLVSAASILAPSDSAAALSLLAAAKSSIPSNRASEDRYYDLLVQAQQASGKLSAAIKSQKERIAVTDHGNGLLVTLDASAKDWDAVKDIANQFSTPNSDPEEITEVADSLSALKSGDKTEDDWGSDQAIKMLEGYLASGANQNIEQVLHARLSLATDYQYKHDYVDAARVANFQPPAGTPLPGSSVSYSQQLAELRKVISELQKNIPQGDKQQ